MKTILLAAGAAALALSAGSALAAAKHSSTVAGPKQPIPYSQLSAYLKASPKQRATKDWWSGQEVASTGANANSSATATAGSDVRSTPDATPGAAATTGTATSATPPSLGGETAGSGATTAPSTPATPSPSGEVNPPAATPSTTPPK